MGAVPDNLFAAPILSIQENTISKEGLKFVIKFLHPYNFSKEWKNGKTIRSITNGKHS